MELASIVKKRAETDKPKARREGWGDGGAAPYFWIAPIDDDLREVVEEESVDPERPFRTEKVDGFRPKKVKNVDPARQTENLIYHAITGWEEFTVADLRSLVSLKYEVPNAGIDLTAVIDFSEGNRRFLGQASSDQFRAWVLTVTSDIASYHAGLEREATGNSPSTSAGA